ncbi:MAG: flagellar hook-associated protein FlgL [Butyrivibrio sp.]|nr:flagellar hook-associated protein FlgL [Butyrivibrio sp.]MBQ8032018.1 flagellar hook-associated protein FlgL [Butyrivibrio sp.]MBR1642979.1 flagellar hook-associated protein FlgL [Butyrivibrio sp.]
MRITNKIMQNNSLYNINNNKVTEDQLNTMMSTGKKITRPSDDPVIAIRALRLRSNVSQLSQYYEKNAKDAESWLQVTADALSTITDVLTDCVKQATKGANKDLTLDDLDTIITQMDALAQEYYSTGNVDYAGRYVFTGYRTDTALTYDKTTTASYTDINDEFGAGNIGESNRVVGKYKLENAQILDSSVSATLENEIVEKTVGRLRLSYDNLDYIEGDGKSAVLKYREGLGQPATSSVTTSMNSASLTFKDELGGTHYAAIPLNESAKDDYTITSSLDNMIYSSSRNTDGTYTITGQNTETNSSYKIIMAADGTLLTKSENVDSAITSLESTQVSTITYTNPEGTTPKVVKVPLLPAIDQSYTIGLTEDGYTATVNSDGTYTVTNNSKIENSDGSFSNEIIQVTGNGSVYCSYVETSITIDSDHMIYKTSTEEDLDNAYNDLVNTPDGAVAYLNAATGEVLLNDHLKEKLSTLPDIINAKSIDMVYDKKEWAKGDIRPENLFACEFTDENGKQILYNKGTAGHGIAYDVGFAQSVVVNTTADAVFTTNVKRDVTDLRDKLSELKQMNSTLKTLNDKLENVQDEATRDKINNQISSAKKAYDFLRENIQKEFEHKITSMQKSLDTANVAVTDNGTRSKRLDLISTRLMSQTTTFKTLQSENEDIDLAEAATQLTTAQVTYEASLMATGKISQTSLMNYI